MDDALFDELVAVSGSRAAVQAVVARHAEPADGWPREGGSLRALAMSTFRQGDVEKAVSLLVVLLDDLGRHFVADDDDNGWHRSEHKYWEKWAYTRTLRSILADAALEHVEAIQASVTWLFREGDTSNEEWLAHSEIEPPSPGLPEDRIVNQLLAANVVDVASVRRAADEILGRLARDDTHEWLERLYLLRRVAERLAANDDPRAPACAAMTAIAAIALEVGAQNSRDLAISEVRDGTASEQTYPLELLLGKIAAAGDRDLRRRLRVQANEQAGGAGERVRRLLGPGDDAEIGEALAQLRAKHKAARKEESRRDLEFEMVTHFADQLSEEEFFSICRSRRFDEIAVSRLLAKGRADDAFAWIEARPGDDALATYSVGHYAREFLEAQEPHLAERLLRAHAGSDAILAGLLVQALAAAGVDTMAKEALAWFQQRPTLDTFVDVIARVPSHETATCREAMLEHLHSRKMNATLLAIASHEEDLATIERLVPSLRDNQLELARTTLKSFAPRLSQGARDLLAPPPKIVAVPAPFQTSPRPAKAAPPTRVSHPKFGKGKVVQEEEVGPEQKYVIEFDAHGKKTLLARFVVPV